MENIQETLMSQYANSPIICNLIDGMNDCLDPSETIETFYELAFNVNTAKGFGLDIWGRIVGVNRNINMSSDVKTFGFETGNKSFYPFNNYPFSAAGAGYDAYQLTDSKFRTLIMIKAASNIVYATAPNINRFLRLIFPKKRSYYLITGHMKARYFLEFIPTLFERHIIYNLGLLPRPSGVLIDYRELPPTSFFGFSGTGFQPFNHGVFA
ncbi:DUF2612 domain-containing protein [Oxalobacter formigenes]|uniref:DUF2612 domain-containing protein n=2 Tax=Oxalobacter formigenes TaxID=847 RepID=UPI0022B01545|nr:DUF2612 domain-containing protein [Oxalobacter formigenes]WAW03483.1 DUF2612 domain-containing protein [Oxalobacter formigenes]